VEERRLYRFLCMEEALSGRYCGESAKFLLW
jgi:hypothetical protein